MAEQDQHNVAAQQAAAKDYQPIYEGLPVGNKTPSAAITDEYVKADPVYVEKTITLPQTYSHYRPIRGDGNCGWRAIGYAYFEKLIEASDRAKIDGEVSRILSFNSLLARVGGYAFADDWAEETVALLRELANNLENPTLAHSINQQKWNDAAISASIIYHLRLLVGTYLKSNAEKFNPFVPDGQDISAYCQANIELPDREIDQIGIIALTDILLQPVDFVLEIAYLDRSPGSQVNQYRFPEEANGQDASTLGPIIYLLFRPNHYDILYQDFSTPSSDPPMAPVDIQINRMSNFSQNTSFAQTQSNLAAYSQITFGSIGMMIPGLTTTTTSMSPAPSPMTDSFPQSQQSSWVPEYSDNIAGAGYPVPTHNIAAPSTPLTPGTPVPAVGTYPGMTPPDQGNGYAFRFSSHHVEYRKNNMSDQFQVQTSMFKNSVFNKAHYGNPEFHPEEWSPIDEYMDGRGISKRKAKKHAMMRMESKRPEMKKDAKIKTEPN